MKCGTCEPTTVGRKKIDSLRDMPVARAVAEGKHWHAKSNPSFNTVTTRGPKSESLSTATIDLEIIVMPAHVQVTVTCWLLHPAMLELVQVTAICDFVGKDDT